MTKAPETPAQVAADLQDERLIREEGFSGAVRAFGRRVRGGDLGSLPVVIDPVPVAASTILVSRKCSPSSMSRAKRSTRPGLTFKPRRETSTAPVLS